MKWINRTIVVNILTSLALICLVLGVTQVIMGIPEIRVVDLQKVKSQSKTYQDYENQIKSLVQEHRSVLDPLESELEAKQHAIPFNPETTQLEKDISELELKIRNLKEEFKINEQKQAARLTQQFNKELQRVISRMSYQIILYQAYKIDPKYDISDEVIKILDGA